MSLLSQDALERMAAKVEQLEDQSPVEYVPVLIRQADEYKQVNTRLLFIGALGTAAVLSLASFMNVLPLHMVGTYGPAIVVFGMLLARGAKWLFPGMSRMLVTEDEKLSALERKAQELFYEDRYASTRNKSGLLIVAGIFEHKVVVLADEMITSKINSGTLEGVINVMREDLKKKNFESAFVKGLDKAGEVIEALGLPNIEDDENELDDNLKVL